jgi:hypothetical protein
LYLSPIFAFLRSEKERAKPGPLDPRYNIRLGINVLIVLLNASFPLHRIKGNNGADVAARRDSKDDYGANRRLQRRLPVSSDKRITFAQLPYSR